jgi:hypothetical protein
MNREHIHVLSEFLGYFQQLVSSDFNIAVCDFEEVIAAHPGKTIDLKLRPGDKLKPGAVATEAMVAGKVITRTVSRELYGIPYIGRAIPLFDENNKVFGSIVVAESTDSKEQLIEMSQKLSSTIQQINASITENTAGLERVSELGAHVEKVSTENLQSVNQTDKIVDAVYNIARQTKLLGLNASIEAARAGEAGKGFKIVANEVGELAENSSNATKQINELLEKLKTENKKVSQESKELSLVLGQLAAASEEINLATQSLSNLSEKLVYMAEKLT